MKKNIVEEKSFDFALRIIKLNKYLIKTKKEYTLSKQLLRSGTSIGANIAESISAQSKADFISKLSISLKEARETKYWIRLLIASEYIDKNKGDNLLGDLEEIIKLLVSTIKTVKKNMND